MIVYHLETPCNWLGWHDVFNQLSNQINNKYNATYHHKFPNIEKNGDHLYIDKFNLQQKDCELIIYDEKKDILKAITWCEVHNCGGDEKCLLDLFKERRVEEINPPPLLKLIRLYLGPSVVLHFHEWSEEIVCSRTN